MQDVYVHHHDTSNECDDKSKVIVQSIKIYEEKKNRNYDETYKRGQKRSRKI